jgi:hypothetical protein
LLLVPGGGGGHKPLWHLQLIPLNASPLDGHANCTKRGVQAQQGAQE